MVGIGASAGGLEALKEFFDNVPQDFQHSFVIVQHLSPDYKSLMTELLAKNTKLPIHEVVNKMEIKPGSIYLIPAKKNMTIHNKVLYLVDKPIGHDLNLPIDIFFNSLAEDQGSKAIGVILTGTGSDGTRGLMAIKEAGGMAMVQNPETARFNGMPKSAVSTGLVDYVLSVDQMPTEILHYISYPKLEHSHFDQLLMKDEDTVMKILLHLKTFTSLDFTSYKRPTLIRRISRRMTVNNCANANDYLKYLIENAAEAQILYREFLIGVTRFFRDAKAYDVLSKKVLPDILKNAKPKQPVKVWSVGCCTGEEAYSIAILIKEAMEKTRRHLDVKIFATDLDKESIERASKGIYEESSVGDITPERLKKFFIKKGNTYQVIQEIRKMIIFSHHNVLQDPPFNKMDLICTRNLMIYLQPNMQKRLLTTLHYALNLNGFLWLGPSETVAEFRKVFDETDRRWKIYKNKEIARTINFDSFKNSDNKSSLLSNGSGRGLFAHRFSAENKLADVLNEALTDELGCASLYVDENLNIVHAYGNLNSYIKLPDKGFSVNLHKMLPDSIVIAINTAIRKSIKEKVGSVYKGVRLRQGNKIRKVVVLVKAFQMDKLDAKKYYLIVFFEHSIEELANKKVSDFTSTTKNSALINDLEQELKETKENLQLTIEELETSNEELQATNEEMLAANEELQSTNEELQSVNEELHTVNAEHQEKIQELANLNADMDNFLKSTEIGTIFLDKNLRIRSFTPAIKDQFSLLPTDVGRPISNFSNNLGNINIVEDIQSVLESGDQIEKEVKGGNKWYLMRLLPYKSETGNAEGAVITFVDITNLVRIKKALAESQQTFDSFMEYSPLLTWIKKENGEYIYVNKSFEDHFNINRKALVGKTAGAIYPIESAVEIKRRLETLLKKWEVDISIEKITRGNESFVYRTTRFPFIGLDERRYVGGISQDITEQVKAEEMLKRSEGRLNEAQEIAHIGSLEIDLILKKHEWSNGLYKIFGISPMDRITPSTETFLSFIHKEDLAFATLELERVIASPSASSFNFRFVTKSGEARYAYSEWKLECNKNKTPIRLYGVVMDVTDRKKSEEERTKMIADIIQRNKNLEQFSYVVSHNLRAPVANILGICNAIDADMLQPAEQNRIIQNLSQSATKLDEVIVDLNRTLNIKKGVNEKKEKVIFSQVANDIYMTIGSFVEKEKAKITWDFSEADEMITIKSYVHSIFYNLISNSLKYHKPGVPPIIELSSRKKKNNIELFFRDNGLGIDLKKNGDKVFGLYKRFHLDKAEGKGMGLYLVKTQIEAIGGEISIKSEVDNGTEFHIKFND